MDKLLQVGEEDLNPSSPRENQSMPSSYNALGSRRVNCDKVFDKIFYIYVCDRGKIVIL